MAVRTKLQSYYAFPGNILWTWEAATLLLFLLCKPTSSEEVPLPPVRMFASLLPSVTSPIRWPAPLAASLKQRGDDPEFLERPLLRSVRETVTATATRRAENAKPVKRPLPVSNSEVPTLGKLSLFPSMWNGIESFWKNVYDRTGSVEEKLQRNPSVQYLREKAKELLMPSKSWVRTVKRGDVGHSDNALSDALLLQNYNNFMQWRMSVPFAVYEEQLNGIRNVTKPVYDMRGQMIGARDAALTALMRRQHAIWHPVYEKSTEVGDLIQNRVNAVGQWVDTAVLEPVYTNVYNLREHLGEAQDRQGERRRFIIFCAVNPQCCIADPNNKEHLTLSSRCSPMTAPHHRGGASSPPNDGEGGGGGRY